MAEEAAQCCSTEGGTARVGGHEKILRSCCSGSWCLGFGVLHAIPLDARSSDHNVVGEQWSAPFEAQACSQGGVLPFQLLL